MRAVSRRLSLAETMIELSPTLWKRWRALSRALHRAVPSIAVANVTTSVPRQLFERVDRVADVVNACVIARRMVTFYCSMADELFRAVRPARSALCISIAWNVETKPCCSNTGPGRGCGTPSPLPSM
jgi:hypothetical protein